MGVLPACRYPDYRFHDQPAPGADAGADDANEGDDGGLDGPAANDVSSVSDADAGDGSQLSDADAGSGGCSVTNDTCPGGQYCSATTGTCRNGCKTSAECNALYDASVFTCDSVRHRCVGCRSDGDCPLGMLCGAGTECVPGCTASHPCDTGEDCCSGSCFDLKFDLSHCGSCDKACDPMPANATSECFASACRIVCDAFMQDCNTDAGDGCEVDVRSDPNNCAVCGHACSGETSCTDRSCL